MLASDVIAFTTINHNQQLARGSNLFSQTKHGKNGCLYQVSTMTVDGCMKLAFHPASPIVGKGTNSDFADAYVELLEKMASPEGGDEAAALGGGLPSVPEGSLSLVAAALGVVGVAIHAGAWSEFFSNLATMKANVQVKTGCFGAN